MKSIAAKNSITLFKNFRERLARCVCFSFFVLTASLTSLSSVNAGRESRIVQISTINALLQGVYDGDTTVDDLREFGDFGLGTFNGLDGEMIVWKGHFYRAAFDGQVTEAEGHFKIPFADITKFDSHESFSLPSNITFDEACRYVDSLVPSKNIFFAMEIQGTFSKLTIRSIPRQSAPYRAMEKVIREQQQIREIVGVKGVLIGFRNPEFMKGSCIPGYHFHFLDENQKLGGHALDFVIDSGRVTIDQIEKFDMRLPHTPEFFTADLIGDVSEALAVVEKPTATVRSRSFKENG